MPKPITKSLHTVTSTLAVARFLRAQSPRLYESGATLAAHALSILGYQYGSGHALTDAAERHGDATLQRIVTACNSLLSA